MREKQILFFVTGNTHKFDEISKVFKNKHLNYQLRQLDLNPIEIQADSLKKVARFKLNSVKSQINGSFFIEDAGFFVDYPLAGFPGVYSSYVHNTIGNKGIIALIKDFNQTKAHFSSVIALYFEPLNEDFLFEGKVEGKISNELRGSKGFGFDPIFIPNEIPGKTFAEIKTEEKNKISHRGRALDKFINFMRNNSF